MLSLFTWMRNSVATAGVMLLGLYIGLPSVLIGVLMLPRASRGRLLLWGSLPLVAAFIIIFYLGWTTAAGIS